MNIFISGISGTGLGPLALMAHDAGISVSGTDLAAGHIIKELEKTSINFQIGPQDGEFLSQIHRTTPIDWFIYTSSLPKDHPELKKAKELGIKTSKRDEFTAFLIKKLGLKLIAVAGTHGKTTTTSMLIWVAQQLSLKSSYIVGTTLGFAPSGHYHAGAEFFFYEADEYDRNFLHFHPFLSIITSVSYDHPDIYPTRESYLDAFTQFESQSKIVIKNLTTSHPDLTLAGPIRRIDATFALRALQKIYPHLAEEKIISALNSFPGVGRRFEQTAENIITDYAHHPEEVKTTIEMGLEEASRRNLKGVIAIYQPHQNTRQHQVRLGYQNAFNGVTQLFWFPTYLTREDPNLKIITPAEFIADLSKEAMRVATPADLDDSLIRKIQDLSIDHLILLMTAGPADAWLRQEFQKH